MPYVIHNTVRLGDVFREQMDNSDVMDIPDLACSGRVALAYDAVTNRWLAVTMLISANSPPLPSKSPPGDARTLIVDPGSAPARRNADINS